MVHSFYFVNAYFKVEYFEKEDFQDKIHDLDVDGHVKLKLAFGIPGES